MRYLIYNITIAFIATITFVSCDSTKSNDREEPTIENIRFNVGDTVHIPKESNPKEFDVITFNKKDKDPSLPDILVIGHSLTISGDFYDNEALSNIYLHIWGDTIAIEDDDPSTIDSICYRLKNVPELFLYGETEKKIDNLMIIDKLEEELPWGIDANRRVLPIRQTGDRAINIDREKYYYSLFCVDKAGNVNDYSYDRKEIIISRRDSVIKYRDEIGATQLIK